MIAETAKIQEAIQEGLRFFDRQDWENAAACFSRAQRLDPGRPAPCFFSSLAHLAQGDIEESKRHLEAGLKIDPQNVLGQNIAALHAFHEKDAARALSLLKQQGLMEHPRVQAFVLFALEKSLLEMER